MSETSSPRILLVDDHVLIRDSLPAAIRLRTPGASFATAASAPAAVAVVEREAWDLVVLDLGLPGGEGELSTLRRLRALRPGMPILVLSMFAEEKMGVAAIEAGATGYLSKSADRAAIARAAEETLAGRRSVSEKLRGLLERRAGAKAADVAVLSPRELEVLLALGAGQSGKQVAATLGIGVTSVATYRTRIMEKLGLTTTTDLLRYVVEHRLVRE